MRWYIQRLCVATGWPAGRPACKRARGVLYRGVRPVPAGCFGPGWGTAGSVFFGLIQGTRSNIAGEWGFCAPLGATSPACLPVQHGHRDSLLAWRPSERKFPPPSPAFRTFGGGALSAFQKVAPDAVPFGPGLPQGHGGWNQGAGARSNRPLGAVAGVRPLWAGGSGQGSPWDILGAMPACPGPPVRPETAPAARGPGRGIRLGEGKHGQTPSSPSALN